MSGRGYRHLALPLCPYSLRTLTTLGKYQEARPYLERSLTIDSEAYGEHSPAVANDLDDLATLSTVQGNFQEARLYLERALAVYEKIYPENHPSVSAVLNNLAYLLGMLLI